jgi:TetR/AcrR family transcriptional regulator
MDVASLEFAAHGFDGTRVDEIAIRSKVSKNLIYYYFESKDALFLAVLEAAHQRFKLQQESVQTTNPDATESLRQLVRSNFEFWCTSRQFIAYLDSANFHKSKHVERSQIIRDAYLTAIDKIAVILKLGIDNGEFRSDIRPLDLYLSISSLAYHFFQFQKLYSNIFEQDQATEEAVSRRRDQIEQMILGLVTR